MIGVFFLLITSLNGGQTGCNPFRKEPPPAVNAEQGQAAPPEEDKKVDDEIFVSDDEEEGEYIVGDTPAYLEDKRALFMDPSQRLGAKPLRLTLEDCIRIALVNNNKVQATEYGIDSAKAKYMEASVQFWPIFEYEWLSAPVPSDVTHALGSFFKGDLTWWNKVKVSIGWPVYAFGKLGLVKDLARGGISAAREMRKKEKISTVTQVRQLYYGVLLAEELGTLLINAHNKLSTESEKKDGRSPVEKIRARVFLVDLEKRLAEAREKEMLALEALRVQMGLNPDVAVMTYSNKLRPVITDLRPLGDYTEIALANRPDAKLVEIGVEAQRNAYRLEKRKWLPDVGVGFYIDVGRTSSPVAGLTTTDNYSNPFNFTRSGIGMRLEGKFDAHGQAARVKKAKSDYYKASLEHYMAKDGISLEVKNAYMEAETALANVWRADKSQKYARQLMFLTESNYELGIGEEEEYTDALQLVLLTRGKYFEAVFEYNVALAVLDEKAGIVPVVGNDYRLEGHVVENLSDGNSVNHKAEPPPREVFFGDE